MMMMMMIYQIRSVKVDDLPGRESSIKEKIMMMRMMMIYQVRSVKDDDLPGRESRLT